MESISSIEKIIPKLSHSSPQIRARNITSLHSKLLVYNLLNFQDVLKAISYAKLEELTRAILLLFNFEEVRETRKIFELLLLWSKFEMSGKVLIDIGGVLMLQQLKIVIPDKYSEILENILEKLVDIRQNQMLSVRKINPNAQFLSVVDESEIEDDDSTYSADPVESSMLTRSMLSEKFRPKPQIQSLEQSTHSNRSGQSRGLNRSSESHVSSFARPSQIMHHTINQSQLRTVKGPNDLMPGIDLHSIAEICDHDRSFLFQLNVKLRHMNTDIVSQAVDILNDFLLDDFPLTLFFANLDIFNSLISLLHSKDELRIDIQVVKCIGTLVQKMIKSALDKAIAIHVVTQIYANSINCLRKVEMIPYVIPYLYDLLPFVEQNFGDPNLVKQVESMVGSLSHTLQSIGGTNAEELAQDYFLIQLVQFTANFLLCIQKSIEVPRPLKEIMKDCFLNPQISFVYKSLPLKILKVFKRIDNSIAKELSCVYQTVSALQKKDNFMSLPSIVEQVESYEELSNQKILEQLNLAEEMMPAFLYDSDSRFFIDRILNELFLFAELASEREDRTLGDKCIHIMIELLSHPSSKARSVVYEFILDDLSMFCGSFLNEKIAYLICVDGLTTEDTRDHAIQLLVAIVKLTSDSMNYIECFRKCIPYLQCFVQSDSQYAADIMGILNVLSEQLDEVENLLLNSRNLFHRNDFIRESASKIIRKFLHLETSIQDPFHFIFSEKGQHEFEAIMDNQTLNNFDMDAARNVVSLFCSSDLDCKISQEIGHQVSELVRVRRFRDTLFNNIEFLNHLIQKQKEHRPEYQGYLVKVIDILRILIHFEPNLRKKVLESDEMLHEIILNAFHFNFDIRQKTCQLLCHLLFEKEHFLIFDKDYEYSWQDIEELQMNKYLPTASFLPFLAVPNFVKRSFILPRVVATFQIHPKRNLVYPPKESEKFIHQMKQYQESKIEKYIDNPSQSDPNSDVANLSLQNQKFVQLCRSIRLSYIIEEYLTSMKNEPNGVCNNIETLYTYCLIDYDQSMKIVNELDWTSSVMDILENPPTTESDDKTLSKTLDFIQFIVQSKLISNTKMEYLFSVYHSNILDNAVISSVYWEQQSENSSDPVSVLNRRRLRKSVLSLLCSMLLRLIGDEKLENEIPLSKKYNIMKLLKDYINPRLLTETKHVGLMTDAVRAITYLSASKLWFDLDAQIDIFRQLFAPIQESLKISKDISLVGSTFRKHCLLICNFSASLHAHMDIRWLSEEALSLISRLVAIQEDTEKVACGFHLASKSLLHPEDLQDILKSVPNIFETAGKFLIDSTLTFKIREQALSMFLSLKKLFSQSEWSDDVLNIIFETAGEQEYPYIHILKRFNVYPKLATVLVREQNPTREFMLMLSMLLQAISEENPQSPILNDKYILSFLFSIISKDYKIENDDPYPIGLDYQIEREDIMHCNALQLLKLAMVNISKGTSVDSFEDVLGSRNLLAQLIKGIVINTHEDKIMKRRMDGTCLLDEVLFASFNNCTPRFDKELNDNIQELTENQISLYQEVYQTNKYFSNDEELMYYCLQTTRTLSLLLGQYQEAQNHAIQLQFMSYLTGILRELISTISIEFMEKNLKRIELISHFHLVPYLMENLRLMRSFLKGNIEAKAVAIHTQIMPEIRTLWKLTSGGDSNLQYEILSLLLNLLSQSPEAKLDLSKDIRAKVNKRNGNIRSYKGSLLEDIIKLTSSSNFKICYLSFRVLSCLSLCTETRSLLIKYNILEEFLKDLSNHLKQKDGKRIEMILHFLSTMSFSKEGQVNLLKTRGLIDLLFQCSKFNQISKTQVALIMRNVAFLKANKAHFVNHPHAIDFLMSCLESKHEEDLEIRAYASSGLWALVYNNQKCRNLLRKPSIIANLRKIEDDYILQYKETFGKDWEDTDTITESDEKDIKFLLATGLENVHYLLCSLREDPKEQ